MVHSCIEISSLSSPIKMPLVRRRRQFMKLSSSPQVTTVDAQGTAYLCFPEDYSWFQGNISTDDESNYSLYGERVVVTAEEKAAAAVAIAEKVSKLTLTESDEENNNSEEANSNGNTTTPVNDNSEQPATEDYYRVTMIDHFSGQKHVLPKIYSRKLEGSTTSTVAPGQLFTSQHEEVTFKVENVYKGQKAEIMIHRYLGSPSLIGVKCLLCTGEINILFDDVIETGRSWSL